MEPSILRLLKNVPLTRDYSDTLVFSTVSEQAQYFQNKMAHSFADLTYIRNNSISVPGQAGSYRQCNYVMYDNPDYPGKWFYGFIISVTYINDGTTRIDFVEDFFQTWYFEMTVKECLVVREHVNNDSIGLNLKDEGLALGEYVTNSTQRVEFTYWWIVIVSALDLSTLSDFQPAEGSIINGTYSGLEYRAYEIDSIDLIQEKLNALAIEGKSDAIVSMYMVPSQMLDDSQLNGGLIVPYPQFRRVNPPSTGNLNGYKPKNNKLLTYPYRGLRLSNNAGQSEVLRYEFFSGNPTIMYAGSSLPNGRILTFPLNYMGKQYNYDYTLTLSDYPQCAWLKDVYANWLATQSIRYGYTQERITMNAERGLIRAGAKGITGALTMNPEMFGSAIGDMVNNQIELTTARQDAQLSLAEEKEVHSMIPPTVSGSVGNENTLMSISAYDIVMDEMTITAQYAKSIDQYLSLYGYKVDEVKVPNIFGRKSWNYVQTIGAIVTGNAPVYAIENYKKLLNNGIRFWHGDYVGDFSRDNSIV